MTLRRLLPWAIPATAALLTGLYGWQLLASHADVRDRTIKHTAARAVQLAESLALQTDTLFRAFDTALYILASAYVKNEHDAFDSVVRETLAAYPAGSVLQLAVVAPDGRLTYSNLDSASHAPLGDRAYLRAHVDAPSAQLHVSSPVLGRESQQWSIQFSRPVPAQGPGFAGVVVLSVSPAYISAMLRRVSLGPDDQVALLREDGRFLAHTGPLERALASRAPPGAPYFERPAREDEVHSASTGVDPVPRIVGWRRVESAPVVALVGLGEQASLAFVEQQLRASLWRSAVGALMFMLFAVGVGVLISRLRRERQALQTVCDVLPVGIVATDPHGRTTLRNHSARQLLGLAPDGAVPQAGTGPTLSADGQPLPAPEHPAVRAQRDGQAVRDQVLGLRRPDGSVAWLSVHALPSGDAGLGVVTAYIDITARTEAVRALEEGRTLLKRAQSMARLGTWRLDLDQDTLTWADEMYHLGHVEPGTAMNLAQLERLLHEEDRERVVQAWLHARRTATPYAFTYRIMVDGEPRWLHEVAEVARDPGGRPVALVGVVQDVTADRLVQARLRESEERLQLALHGTNLGLWDWDLRSGRVDFNARWADMLGYTPGEIRPHIDSWYRLVHPQDLSTVNMAFARHVAGDATLYECEYRMRHKLGHWVWVQDNGKVTARAQDGSALRAVGTQLDLSARKELEQSLETFRFAVEGSSECVLMYNPQGHIFYANRAATLTLGYARSQLLGMPLRRLYEGAVSDDELARIGDGLAARAQVTLESRLRTAHGTCLDVELSMNLLRQEDASFTTLVFRDITQRKRHQEEVEHIAFHDALTGLPNRRLMADRLTHALALATRHHLLVAVCYMDLDGFKPVNDQHGHEAGDRLLMEIADRLRATLRAHDTVARLGGDEFVLLLTELRSVDECMAVVDRVREAVSRPFALVDGEAVCVTASIGLVFYPFDSDSPDQLLRQADQAMYQAKMRGRNQVHQAALGE